MKLQKNLHLHFDSGAGGSSYDQASQLLLVALFLWPVYLWDWSARSLGLPLLGLPLDFIISFFKKIGI